MCGKSCRRVLSYMREEDAARHVCDVPGKWVEMRTGRKVAMFSFSVLTIFCFSAMDLTKLN